MQVVLRSEYSQCQSGISFHEENQLYGIKRNRLAFTQTTSATLNGAGVSLPTSEGHTARGKVTFLLLLPQRPLFPPRPPAWMPQGNRIKKPLPP